ncbi:MAG: hypothetical protein UDG86_01730 [Lachnospiraceae bacterium]|nr:hypothetical protein [Lachnospiraceae bacterium]
MAHVEISNNLQTSFDGATAQVEKLTKQISDLQSSKAETDETANSFANTTLNNKILSGLEKGSITLDSAETDDVETYESKIVKTLIAHANGTNIRIKELSEENKKRVDAYKQWRDKALDAKKAVQDAKVEQTDFTTTIDGIRQDTALANRGINKWLVEIYPKFSLPTKNQGKYNIDAFWGNNIEPDQTLEVADGETHSSDIVQNNSILYGLTYVYFEEKTKIDTDFYHNNASTLYLNGSSVVSNATNGKSTVTLNFSKGWNIIEAVVNTTTGTKGFKFTTALSQHASCKSMNCHIARPTRRQTSQIDRIADIHIELDQITQEVSANAQSIIEKADGKDFMSLQSLVNETVNTVSEHIQEIGALRNTLADDYTSTADLKSQFNQKSGEVYQSVTAAYKTTIDQTDELAKGLNKWIIEVYPKSGISSTVVPYPKEVLGISPSKILEYAESSLSTSMNIGDYYIGHAQTYVKFSSNYNFATTGNSISLTTNGKPN